MAHSGQEKIHNGNEEFNEFEEVLVRRHLEAMRGELIGKLEEMDRRKAEELLREGGYIDKGYVRRKVQTSVGPLWVRVKRLKRKNMRGS